MKMNNLCFFVYNKLKHIQINSNMTEDKLIEQYQELDEISHVLQCSEVYVGTKSLETKSEYVIDDATGKMVKMELESSPALIKIIDEIISNSIDEYRRTAKSYAEADAKTQKTLNRVTKIDVCIDANGHCKVTDNGGITTAIHPISKVPVPVMIFGRLRSGSNFDQTKERDTVGKNGMGSVLTNMFSNSFTVITSDGTNRLTHNWTNNMRNSGVTKIEPWKHDRGTIISFDIDMTQFPYETIPFGVMKLIERKCILGAASHPGLSMTFNGIEYKFNSFREYVNLYGFTEIYECKSKEQQYEAYLCPANESYECGIVNGAECNIGSHIGHLRWETSSHLMAYVKRKHGIDVPRGRFTKRMACFVNVRVVKPVYESQAKLNLTTHQSMYTGTLIKTGPDIPKKYLNQISESTIVTEIIDEINAERELNEQREVQKRNKDIKNKKLASIHKLVDAQANARSRHKCRLWLFEGQSAGAYFRTTRDPNIDAAYYLKGKSMNTVEMRTIDIAKNAEISDIAKASGLQFTNVYDDIIDKLRYGQWIIASDADVDGHSIACQIITTFGIHFKPVVDAGLLFRVRTPIVKARKAKDIQYFYSMEEFHAAKLRGYDIKYLKGLGSMQKEDFREMLKNPRLEQVMPLTDDDIKIIKAWMGDDSNKRKQFLVDSNVE